RLHVRLHLHDHERRPRPGHLRVRVLHLPAGVHEPEHGLRGCHWGHVGPDRARDRCVPDPDPHAGAGLTTVDIAGSVPGGAPPPRRLRMRNPWPFVIGLGLLCASGVLPLLFMAFTAFRTERDWDNSRIGLPTTWSFGAFQRAWTDAN